MMLGVFLGVFYISGYVALALTAAYGVRRQRRGTGVGRAPRVDFVERRMVHRSSTHPLRCGKVCGSRSRKVSRI